MPDEYSVSLVPSAQRELQSLHDPVLRPMRDALMALRKDPRPRGCRKLVGREPRYRLRVGDYRVVYAVNDLDKTVLVYRIRHRSEVCD